MREQRSPLGQAAEHSGPGLQQIAPTSQGELGQLAKPAKAGPGLVVCPRAFSLFSFLSMAGNPLPVHRLRHSGCSGSYLGVCLDPLMYRWGN